MFDMNGFQQFMQQMRGQDPNKIINDMVQSGKLTQQQLNMVQMQAKQVEEQLAGMRKMFGL